VLAKVSEMSPLYSAVRLLGEWFQGVRVGIPEVAMPLLFTSGFFGLAVLGMPCGCSPSRLRL
jgi:hypothetical protein